MAFKYRPLDRTKKEIRLLELFPRNHDKKRELIPTCRIFHAYLPDKPRFVALSYVWGDVHENRVIVIGNSPVRVRQNLYDAMVALRPLDEPLVIWIDALCINQGDNQEKSWQVDLMKNIYGQAKQVLAWLGPAYGESDSVMDHLNSFGAKAEACGIENDSGLCLNIWRELAFEVPGSHVQKASNLVVRTSTGVRTVRRKAFESLFYSISGWHDQKGLISIPGMKSLITRPWWGRIWVLQEIALPENAEFVCGTKRVTQRRCSAAINAYYAWWLILMEQLRIDKKLLTQYQLEAIGNLSFHRPNVMLAAWRVYRYDRFPLAALLRATCVGSLNLDRHGPHNMESTDPRDKIFALLSLASDRDDLRSKGVFPDYSKSCRDVYTSTMVALIQQGHMSLLSLCQNPKIQPGLPSWVPDWSRSTTHMLQDVENDHVTIYPNFSASGVEPSTVGITVIKRNEVITGISLEGYVYDEIYNAGSFSGRAASNEVPLLETFSWPARWLIEFLRLTYHSPGKNYAKFEDRLRAAARSSIGDVGWNQSFKLARIGDDRFFDAVILLQNGITNIKETRIRREAEQFLANKATKETFQSRTRVHERLGSEVIGKSLRRLPFVTKKGHLVLSYEYVKQGDSIALIRGTQVPFILRRTKSGEYELIGEAYVDGIMDGEAVDNSKFGTIHLV